MIDLNKEIKIPLVKYPKSLLLGQMGLFDLIVVSKYARLYLRTCSKKFFKLFAMVGDNKSLEMTEVKFTRKSFLGLGYPVWNYLSNVAPKI